MVEEELKFAKNGKNLKTLIKIWGQDQLEPLWTELIQMAITNQTIAAGQPQANKQKPKEGQLILTAKIVVNFVGEPHGAANVEHAMNIEGEIKPQDPQTQKKLH